MRRWDVDVEALRGGCGVCDDADDDHPEAPPAAPPGNGARSRRPETVAAELIVGILL